MTAKTYLRCIRALWWTQIVALAAAMIGTASTVVGRVRDFPPYINPLDLLFLAIVAEGYVVVASVLTWATLFQEQRNRGDWFLLLTCFSIVATVGTWTFWAVLDMRV